jgi:hypothetical protein
MSGFSITMNIYGNNPITGHHDVKIGRVEQSFKTAAEMSEFWEANKSFEREGKARAKAKQKSDQQFLNSDSVSELIAHSRRSSAGNPRQAEHSET